MPQRAAPVRARGCACRPRLTGAHKIMSCAPLDTEREIAPANCSALTDDFRRTVAARQRECMGGGTNSGCRNLRFQLAAILSFVHHSSKLLHFGSGQITWTGPFVATLSLLQSRMGLYGAVGEIGVHHGMFAIAVAHQARHGEHILAADLFDALQNLNVDHSGSGDLRRFLRNMGRFGIRRDDMDLRVGLSSSLPLPYAHPLRLFSVDGGHTEAITAGDIAWAACHAVEGGIIILDDWPNPGWPGVKLGAARNWRCGARRLTPFAEMQNKLYLTTSRAAAEHYQAELGKMPFWAARLAAGKGKKGWVHAHSVLRLNDASPTTAPSALARLWHRTVLQQANFSSSSERPRTPAAAPRWTTRLQAESLIAKWKPERWPFRWVQNWLLDLLGNMP